MSSAPWVRFLLPLWLALSLLIGSEGRSLHELEHVSWQRASVDSLSQATLHDEACLVCLAYAPLSSSPLPAGLPRLALLAGGMLLLSRLAGLLACRFEIRFRSRAPPFLF